MDQDRKPPRFILNCGKRPTDNNDSLTTPIIDPNAPLSTTGPHFPSFDHQTDNAFGQYLQELSQSVSSDVYENNKQSEKSTTFPPFPSLTTSSIPTPAIKYNHRHQQSQQSHSHSHSQPQPQPQPPPQPQPQPQPQIQIQAPAPAQPATQSQHQPPCVSQVPSPSQHPNHHSLTNGQNNHSQPTSNSAPSPPSDIKPNVPPFHVSSSARNYTNYISPKHGGIDYVSINSSHPVPIPVTVITTGCLSSASSTSTITPQSRIVEHNQQFISTTPPSASKLSINNTNSAYNNTLATSDEVPSSSSRTNHLSVSRRLAPFSPVSTVSTSSQASTVGKESMQYIIPSESDDERSSRATPGRKKKMDPSRRSKLTKKEKLDKIISEEKRLQASNTALKQRMKVMENDCNLLQNIITNILIDAAKRKQSDSLQSSQENQGNLKESST